ncbi:GDP-mannose transporter GONST1-like isoform X2 [Carya illinoinensis]|uniref:GDP-mannose transporter GONST1-like isoform X2 n=1 Tax=Carya illinoinensis TaxID=32201 RepID=UPI001C72110A|nr:GDP-mannose transporter GONST1-like isoform X2 [Carya illinoinensis]
MNTFENKDNDLETGKLIKDGEKTARSSRVLKIHNQALLSGFAYCISSCSMILINKFVLSSYDFNAGISLMLYQNLISVIIVSILSFLGIISTEPLTWRLVKVWFPVNVIFVGMLITSMFSLKYINVAMVTVLKNVTNVITALGEMYLFSKHHDSRVWAALFLMIISAISGGITDLSFHAVGYAWQIINCFLTASYSATIEVANLLVCNDIKWSFGTSNQLHFYVVSSSNWGYNVQVSLVGSLNKIPLSIAGILIFKVPTSLENSASIFFGLIAGVIFARAKMRERSQT